jgi:hypothetical protein
MCVNASNERIAARGADGIHKGFQEPIVGGVGAAEERRVLGEIEGDAALEEESSGDVPAGAEPNDAPSNTVGSVYRALYWSRIERNTIAHRVEIFHGEAPPRRLGETEWNLHHRGGRSNMSNHAASRPARYTDTVSSSCRVVSYCHKRCSHIFSHSVRLRIRSSTVAETAYRSQSDRTFESPFSVIELSFWIVRYSGSGY